MFNCGSILIFMKKKIPLITVNIPYPITFPNLQSHHNYNQFHVSFMKTNT